MAITWSRVHASLAIPPGPLTYEMIEQAVEQNLIESDDLDWKASLPANVEEKMQEFAKDVAAMANTRGELLAYGVEEDHERAAKIVGVANGERERQRLRQLAAGRISPLVKGLEIVALDASRSGKPGLMVVAIPASPGAPHVIGEKSRMGVPYRDGPHTAWMAEYQLERAYADRFSRRYREAAALDDLLAEVADQLSASRPWLTVAARPTVPGASVSSPPVASDVPGILTRALEIGAEIAGNSNFRVPVLRELGSGAQNPRVALRRWVVSSNPFGEPGTQSNYVHVDLHHGGSIGFAALVRPWGQGSDNAHVHVRLIESAVVDAVAIAVAHARHLGIDSTIAIRLAFYPAPDADQALIAVSEQIVGTFVVSGAPTIVPGSRQVKRFITVDGEIDPGADSATLRDSTARLVEDVLHQFGVQRLAFLSRS